jgi:aspartate racemase
MKKIGIIGGISPTSTKLYYDLLIKSSLEKYYCYPEIIIYSVDFNKCWKLLSSNRIKELSNDFLKVINLLRRAGADYIVISAVSMHIVMNYLKDRTPLPIIDGWDCLIKRISQDQKKNILLMGTDYIMKSHTFNQYFDKYRINLIIPSKGERQEIEFIIKNQLNKGIIQKNSKQKLLSVINTYKNKIDGVCLACTALPTIIQQLDLSELKLYNFVELHVEKITSYIK